jgi:hypothetical protein
VTRSCAWLRAGVASLGLAIGAAAPAATITIQVMDGVGEGFNDPTPFTPIGGNTGTTLGQARLNVFKEAARLWGLLITSSQTIVVEATFDPLTCGATTGVLGSAGPTWVFHDFPNAPLPNVFYPAALADELSGSNLAGTLAGGGKYGYTDIKAQFNSTIGDPSCLGGSQFYYGFDHQFAGGNYIADLLGVVLHELGHGLGFLSLVDQTGAGQMDSSNVARLGVFDQFVYDESTALFWPQMTAAQRAQSEVGQAGASNASLVFNATQVNANLGRETAGLSVGGHLRLYAPASYDATSSVSHWDSSATPDLLMEPQYSNHTGNHTDLTTCVLYALGWQGSHCPDILSALGQSVSTTAGKAVTITLGTGNGGGGALSYAIIAQPTHGKLGTLTGAVVTYTPAAGFTGADQFSFRVSDALLNSNVAIVAIDVKAAPASGGGSSGGTSGGSGGAGASAAPSGGGGAVGFLTVLALALVAALGVRARLLRQRATVPVRQPGSWPSRQGARAAGLRRDLR